MIGESVPTPGGPRDLDALLIPPRALPHQPGRVRRYEIAAVDREIEVAKGVYFNAWTYNGTVPGPVIRATQDDILEVAFTNSGSHPHTIHFHGIHPSGMDGVFEIVEPGAQFTYRFPAKPYGMQLYHCHTPPLKKHIHKGLYGAFIIDPPEPRRPAHELVFVMNGFDTDGDGENNLYTVNGRAFYYARYPDVRRADMSALEHYLATGWREGRDPNAWFSTRGYVERYPDVASAGSNPLWDFIKFGWRAGRCAPCADPGSAPEVRVPRFLLESGFASDPAALSAVAARLDAAFYQWQLRELGIGARDLDYARHYLRRGAAYAIDPAPWFSGDDYLRDHDDVFAAGHPPFLHYVVHGEAEGRRIFPSTASGGTATR